MNDPKRILVTGGAGFIGSNLCKTLLEQGAFVDCVDNLITGRMEAISSLLPHRRFRYFQSDITTPSFVKVLTAGHYDEIYHLACPTGVPNIALLGEEMLKTCSTGTRNVLEIACTHKSKIVYTSSAEVYGDPKDSPQKEEYCGNVDPVGPRSAYEEGKRFSEALISTFVKKYRLDAKIVRVFNTYGANMSPHDTRLVPSFVRKIKKREKLIIYGDGTQTRTHLYIDDLIAGLLVVMERGHSGEVYNVGGETPLSIIDLAHLIGKLAGFELGIEHRPHFIEDHSARLPQTAKVKRLGWSPKVALAEGLRLMLEGHQIPAHWEHGAVPAAIGR